MSENKRQLKRLLDDLDEVTLDLIYSDVNSAKEFLTKEGIDPEKEHQYCSQQVKKLKFLAKAQINKSKDDLIINAAINKLRSAIESHSEKAGMVLRKLLQEKAPSFQFRKLETWSDEEMREVLNDVDLVRLMEELENEE